MRLFDSNINKSWRGTGFSIKENSIMVFKGSNFEQPIPLKVGTHTLKIFGKKRTGSGPVIFQVWGGSEVLSTFEVDFSSGNWSENSYTFDILKETKSAKLKISRGEESFGSIEIIKIFIDSEKPEVSINTNSLPRNQTSDMVNRMSMFSDAPEIRFGKKVAFIIPYGIYGGAEVYLKNIINKFAERYQIQILYLNQNILQNHITRRNVVHKVIQNMEQLPPILRSNNYDFVVYYNRADIYNLLITMKEKREFASNLIEIYHSDFVWPGSLSQIRHRKHLYKFVTIAKSLCEDVKGVEDIKEVIPVGIDIELFSPRKNEGLKESLGLSGKRVIGTVARLSKEKNIDLILDLSKIMPEYSFVILGDGPEKARLLERVKVENILNVIFLGHISDTSKYYNIFDAFILLSRIEGTPISIIEAMASGVPVFSNGVGAIPDLVKDGETGFILKNGDNIKSIIEGGISNQGVIDQARKFVLENHDVVKNSEKFIELFKTVYDMVPVDGRQFKIIPIKGDIHKFVSINKASVKPVEFGELVTIIVNNYNKGKLLRKAVLSALNQEYKNIELIVIDDDSKDNVSEILSGIDDPRLTIYLNKSNCGAYACRNFGMDNSNGKYITFLDSDDYILSDHIGYLVATIKQFGLKAVNSKYKRITDSGQILAEGLCEVSILFSREILNDVGYFHMVRGAADSEFRERMIKYYGGDKIGLLKYTSYAALKMQDSITTSPKTGYNNPARKDYVKKFRRNKYLYYHYSASMDFLNLGSDILAGKLKPASFIKIK